MSWKYAKRLQEANVSIHYQCYKEGFHGFLSLPIQKLSEQEQALKDIKLTRSLFFDFLYYLEGV